MDNQYQDIADLLRFYRRKENPTVEERMFEKLKKLPKEERAKVIDWIFDHCSRRNGLDFSDLNEAIHQTGAGGFQDGYIPATTWKCDLCGEYFMFAEHTTGEWQQKKNIHCKCPKCGLYPGDTHLALRDVSGGGGEPVWYEQLKIKLRNGLDDRKGKWYYDPQEKPMTPEEAANCFRELGELLRNIEGRKVIDADV
jgi:hypothetical protein